MFTRDPYFEEIEAQHILNNLSKPQINISVLRHLSRPLDILEKDESYLNFSNPVCCYTAPLHGLPEKLLPTQENTQKQQLQQTRLISMYNAQTEFQQVKRMFERSRFRTYEDTHTIDDNYELKGYVTKTKTLYNMFSLKSPYYCRFYNHNVTKNNFANVFLNVAGLNLEAKAGNGRKSSGMMKFPKMADRYRLFNTGSLVFDSSFYSGNLLYVYQRSSYTYSDNVTSYQLILQNDTNTYGHNQWFFFRVQSLKPHNTVKFSIMNLIKSESLFNYGLKPLVFSYRDNTTRNIGWHRRGYNIKYYQNDIRRENKRENYFTLEFEYTFREINDWVYFCPSYPYTYTQMTGYVENLYVEPEYKRCFSVKTVCYTLGRNKVNLVTISTGERSIEECKIVWVLARQHPSETTGSYMVEGMLRYLLPLISYAKSSDKNSALSQLHNYVFKIIPMVNVDGVIHGNSRAYLIGLDPNRYWKKPRKTISPVTHHILKYILACKSNVSLVLDLHSHSKKTGCFFYGNYLPLKSKLAKIYPTLVCYNDYRFYLKNCRFRGGYRTTARHVLFRYLSNCEQVFTVECSLLGYMNKKTNRVTEYTIQDYHEMGAKLIENFFKLENIKLYKGVNQIIEEFNERIEQVCEVDSARSDSGVSDDEYDEVKELEKRLVHLKKKKPQQADKRDKINKSLITSLAKQYPPTEDKAKPRAFSFAKQRTRNVLTKIYDTSTSLNTSHQLCNLKHRKHHVEKDNNQSSTTISVPIYKYVLRNLSSNMYSQALNTFSSLKQSYKKYLLNPKANNVYKTMTEDVTTAQCRVKTDYGVQVTIEHKNVDRRVLQAHQNPQNALTIFADSKIRPLLVLGNTCQAEIGLFGKNYISVQVSATEADMIKKENKAISKLPKLMSLITSSKEKMKKQSLAASKENQNLYTTATAARYPDHKTLVYDEKPKKTKLVNNFKSNNNA